MYRVKGRTVRVGNRPGWKHSYILGGYWGIECSLVEPRENPNASWDEEMKECGQITKKAGPAMSKTVQGWIETVGGDGGRQGRVLEERKGGKGKCQGAEKNKPTDGRNDYLIFDLIILN